MSDYIIQTLKGLLWGLAVCGLITLLCGCRTKYVAAPERHTEYAVRTDTVYISRKDSVRVLDSVMVERWRQGDTVYISRDRWRYRDRILADTLLRTRTDTMIRTDTVTLVVTATEPAGTHGERTMRTVLLWVLILSGVAWTAYWYIRGRIK